MYIFNIKTISERNNIMDYKLNLADELDVEDVFNLIKQRIKWMDKVGIKQWNVTDYCTRFPKEHYLNQIKTNNLYVLRQTKDNNIVGAVVCFDKDERWPDYLDVPAYYLHNFVTDPNIKGAGKIILKYMKELALSNNKKSLRLECAIDNSKINNYYEQNGFALVGTCDDGPYTWNRREKVLI